MKADNKIKINQRRIDFLHVFVNTILPRFCEEELAVDRGMDVATRTKHVNTLIKYNEQMKEGAFDTTPRNSKYASFSAKIKYLGQVHTITNLHAINEAAEKHRTNTLTVIVMTDDAGRFVFPRSRHAGHR